MHYTCMCMERCLGGKGPTMAKALRWQRPFDGKGKKARALLKAKAKIIFHGKGCSKP